MRTSIAFMPAQVRTHSSPIATWLIAHQGTFFFPILLLEGLSLHASSVRRICSKDPLPRQSI